MAGVLFLLLVVEGPWEGKTASSEAVAGACSSVAGGLLGVSVKRPAVAGGLLGVSVERLAVAVAMLPVSVRLLCVASGRQSVSDESEVVAARPLFDCWLSPKQQSLPFPTGFSLNFSHGKSLQGMMPASFFTYLIDSYLIEAAFDCFLFITIFPIDIIC
ncbi:hypothetical protein X953_16630 [Virgibacillus sp. SK37]|nr:hypothetical protein X953_16630 [Virgibacillus sp. SK37]